MKKTILLTMFALAALFGATNEAGAQVSASFTYTVSNATVNFTNTSSVSGLAIYEWNFGDNQYAYGTASNPDAVHNYNAAGTYTVTLIARDSNFVSVSDTFIAPVTVTAGCNNLAATVNSTAASACSVCDGAMSANVTGGNAPFTYLWSTSATTSSVTNMCAGYYQLTVTDAIGCAVTVNPVVDCPDSCHADFSYWVSGNTVNLSNQSNDTSNIAAISFQWDFGDASGYNGTNPWTHTYATPGTYNVMLIMNNSVSPCTDTIVQSVTVGGPTSCSAYFSMQQDSFILNQWYINAYATGQPPFTYLWDFGDTTTSTLAMPNHSYTYPTVHHVVCLTITDANSCTSMYCDSSMSHRLSVGAASMGSLTVVSMTATATGIEQQDVSKMKIWPNPSSDIINVSLSDNTDAVLRITDLVGNVVMEQQISANELKLDVSNLPAGIYNINISNSNMNENQKIVIVR